MIILYITINVDITDIYLNDFKLSIKLINNDKTNINAKIFIYGDNIFIYHMNNLKNLKNQNKLKYLQ